MEFVQQFVDNILFYSFVLIFVISLVVFVHEMGHYLTAKLFGVQVKKFSIGFGRELIGKTSKSGTRWSLSLIPLGGYVDLFGYSSSDRPQLWDAGQKKLRDFTSQEKCKAFCFKPLWQRTLIVAMGPIANFLLALLVLAGMFFFSGEKSTLPVIYAVAHNTPADEAGLRPLDRVIKLDGQNLKRFEDAWEKSWTPGTSMVWTIQRGERVFDVPLETIKVEYLDKRGIAREHGRIGATNMMGVLLEEIDAVDGIKTAGDVDKNRNLLLERMGRELVVDFIFPHDRIEPFWIHPVSNMNEGLLDPDHEQYETLVLRHKEEDLYIRHSVSESFWYAGRKIYSFIDEAIKFLNIAFFKEVPEGSEKIGGLVTMGKITGKAIDAGWYTFFLLIAVFSVQIGFINLLPVPALDGGYLAFFAYEAVARKPLSERIQDYALSIGLFLLLGLMLVANMNDILDLINSP